MDKKISVIIPTYNRPKQLQAAIKSVLTQTLVPDEIVVVNDGDHYEDFEKFLDEGIIYHKNPQPMGGNFSRNKGVALSSGDFLMFLDDDDTWKEEKISKQMACFQRDENIGLVYCNRVVVDESGTPIRRITSSQSGYLYPAILFSNIIGTTSSVAIKRNVFEKTGGFDVNIKALQDYDLWIRASKITHVGLVNEHVINYTVAKDAKNQVSKSGDKQEKAVGEMLIKYKTDIYELSNFKRRKAVSNFLFYIAKSYRGSSFWKAANFALRSFLSCPNIKALAILLPKGIVNKLIK